MISSIGRVGLAAEPLVAERDRPADVAEAAQPYSALEHVARSAR